MNRDLPKGEFGLGHQYKDSKVEQKKDTEPKPEKEYVLDIDEIFSEFGIEEGTPASLEQVTKLFQKYQHQIADNAKKNFWRILQGTMASGTYATPRAGSWIVKRQGSNRPYRGEQDAKVSMGLLIGGKTRGDNYKRDRHAIGFTFSSEGDTLRALERSPDVYSPESLSFEGVSVNRTNHFDSERNFSRSLDDHNIDQVLDDVEDTAIDPQALRIALEQVLENKDYDFSEVRAVLLEYFKGRKGKDREDAKEKFEKVLSAIKEFGNYMYEKGRTSSGLAMTGDCLVTPNRFSTFCHKKFGLDAKVRHYGLPDLSGMSEREFEEVAEHTKKTGRYHEINVLFGNLAIDWTGKQFGDSFRGRATGFPAIYELTEDEQDELFSYFRGGPHF